MVMAQTSHLFSGRPCQISNIKLKSSPSSSPFTICKVCNRIICSSLDTSSSPTEQQQQNPQQFSYSRASPSVRWPKHNLKHTSNKKTTKNPFLIGEDEYPHHDSAIVADVASPSSEQNPQMWGLEENPDGKPLKNDEFHGFKENPGEKDAEFKSPYVIHGRNKVKQMNKLALKREKDWRTRVQFVTHEILRLGASEFVDDVLERRRVHMTAADYCFVVKCIGKSNWQRALEVYEWLSLRHWSAPCARMLATILSVLGKANQEIIAVELFEKAEPAIVNVVQVYNSMMGVHARHGRFIKVQVLFDLMVSRGCEPDIVSFNTLINARAKSGLIVLGCAMSLLDDVRKSRLRPDIITYNTLISACSSGSNLDEAIKIYREMESNGCEPDIWTLNTMISVYGRCGMANAAESMFNELGRKGYFADAVTFNSLLFAFARDGNFEKVDEVCKRMVEAGYKLDEVAYNTMIDMYAKHDRHDVAFQLYKDMKSTDCSPDAVTYTVLIDSFGKTGRIMDAAYVFGEMLRSGVRPTLRTFSALICGYAKAGMHKEAEQTFERMFKYGIKPDKLAYSVVLDVVLKTNDTKKVLVMYRRMMADGFKPDEGLYQVLLKSLVKENKHEDVERVIADIEDTYKNPSMISDILVYGECPEQASDFLKLAVMQGYKPDQDNLLSILNSFFSMNKHEEAHSLLDFLNLHAPNSCIIAGEALIVMLCKTRQLDAALEEYYKVTSSCKPVGSSVYESLILCCEVVESYDVASQLFSEMKFYSVEPTPLSYSSMAISYCKMGFPETADESIRSAEKAGVLFQDLSVYVTLIQSYGELKLWQHAERVVSELRQPYILDRKIWNSLLGAYAASGCYERARAVFHLMMRDGLPPTVESINSLMQALITARRLDELNVVVEELQDMGFKISKATMVLMLDAFARAGNIFEVKKIYHGMKAAGYLPTMHLYRSMIGLLARGNRVQDVEAMVAEMEQAGFRPDVVIFNYLLRLYTQVSDFRMTALTYSRMKEEGLQADEDTYNALICMYSKDLKAEEGFTLLREMISLKFKPRLASYVNLLTACGKQELWDLAENLFQDIIQSGESKVTRIIYHIMLKIYGRSGNHVKAEYVLGLMKRNGMEPTVDTMHTLMDSYGTAGQPAEAENVLNRLKVSGLTIGTAPYASVIDAYLKHGDHESGIAKLTQMKEDAVEPDYRIWACFMRAASLCERTDEAIVLLNALSRAGFNLPLRILAGNSESMIPEVDALLNNLDNLEDDAPFIFVNALEDLLWAFEKRATASWVFQLAVKKRIYKKDVFRVADRDWGADFRKLSAGAALVGLSLWLDDMQDASLQGIPESPKKVVLITGTAEYQMVSISKTIKAYLWEMGSPFLPSKTRDGILIAKAHSLRMWLKESAFCLDMELRDSVNLPEVSSMQLVDGFFMRAGLVPIYKEIHERLGDIWPKKFAKLALLSDEKRDKFITAEIEGRKEKLEKMKKRREGLKPQQGFGPHWRRSSRRSMMRRGPTKLQKQLVMR